MFETAELGQTLGKSEYKRRELELREALLELQQKLRRLRRSQVIVVFAGVDGGGKGDTVNVLNAWMDPRWLVTHAFDQPADVERERPEFWRYWQALPPRGRIGMFLSSWYSPPVLQRVHEGLSETAFDARLDRILTFERELANDGAVILKFWMHLSREAQAQRFESLEAAPLARARITPQHWRNWERYDDFIAATERVIMRTNTGSAPWRIVEGVDPHFRRVAVGEILRDTLRRRIEETGVEARLREEMAARVEEPPAGKQKKGKSKGKGKDGREVPSSRAVTVLSSLDMSRRLGKRRYARQLGELQARLHVLHEQAKRAGRSTLVVFEGPDAAGKGGAIRRITASFEARNYRVHGVAAPTDEERAQHYLWRFWRRLPRAGRVSIFDRSWYGRVLVERVEGFASEEEWRRAYAEINDFEEQLIEHGTVLLKFWIHITPDEQLERFELRERTPHKRWKLTDEDWRNRDKWGDYERAVHDMVQYTSTRTAPWTLVEGNDKRYARVRVLEHLTERLEEALGDDESVAE